MSFHPIIFLICMMIATARPLIIQNAEMVTNLMIRKNPSTTTKRHHGRRAFQRKKLISSAKPSAVTSTNKSIVTYRCRLFKFFTKLPRMVKSCGHLGYRFLGEEQRKIEFKVEVKRPCDMELGQRSLISTTTQPSQPSSLINNDWCLLPPLVGSEKKRTIVLDLDETLVHTRPDPPPEAYDFVVRPIIQGETVNLYVRKRPGVDDFLKEISEKFEVVVFTAGLKKYASLALDNLDPGGLISHRLYRDSCTEVGGRLVKDLSQIGRDLGKVLIVDDNPKSYALQPENAIPIRPFKNDVQDRELERVVTFLKVCDLYEDTRDAVKQFLGGTGDYL